MYFPKTRRRASSEIVPGMAHSHSVQLVVEERQRSILTLNEYLSKSIVVFVSINSIPMIEMKADIVFL